MLRARKLVGVRFNNADGSLPQLGGPDPILKTGSRFLFDFRKKSCWPSQDKPAAGAVIKNLVKNADGTSAPDATVVGSNVGFSGGGMVFGGVSNNYINLGTSYDFSQVTDPTFVMSIFVKIDSSKTDAYQQIIGKGSNSNAGNVNAAQYSIDSGPVGGKRPRAVVTTASVAPVSPVQADVPLDTVIQLGMALEEKKVKIFLNGVFSYAFSQLVESALSVPQAINTVIGSSVWKGIAYRAYFEDLKVSGKTAAEIIAAEYNAHNGTF